MKPQNNNLQLKNATTLYQVLVESVKDYALIMLDEKGHISLWNVGAERMSGYKSNEVIGEHFSIFYFSAGTEAGNKVLAEVRKKGKVEEEGWQLRKDGSKFWANVLIAPVCDENDTIIGYSKIIRDLTEKKKSEEALRQSEERYRLLVAGVKDYAIFMMDPQGVIVSWNEGAKRLKGYSDTEIIGKHFSIFYTKEAVDTAYPQYELKEAIKHGRFEDEGWRVRKDGSLFYANVIITTLYNAQKQHIGFSKVTRDLTERKKAEDKMQSLNIELEQRVKERTEDLSRTVTQLKKINSDLDNFIYTASHDLKAPVSNIEGLMESLEEELKENKFVNEEVSVLLAMINKSVSRFQQTIKDLTAVNQSQRNEPGQVVAINLKDIYEDIAIGIDHLIKESKAQIELEIKDDHTFRFSRTHFRSIVYNLLTNAIKYRSPDRQLIIQMKSYSSGNYFVLEVSDNGLGIKEENKEKVFQMFRRLHDHVEGSGIGLYIVRRIVDNAGGKVQVESEEGKGTTFKVYLPKG